MAKDPTPANVPAEDTKSDFAPAPKDDTKTQNTPEPGSIAAQIDGLPLAEQPPAPDVPAELPKVARVRSKVGPMRHLMTNVEITAVERKIDIDFFAEAQIRAGKWEIVED